MLNFFKQLGSFNNIFKSLKMDEKEVLLAMKRLRKIEEEARRRLIKEKEEKEKAKTKVVPAKAVPKAKSEVKTVPAKPETKSEASKPKSEASKPKSEASKPKSEASKPKKTVIPAAIKTLVWNKWVGEKEAESGCYACRVTSITMRHFHCGHVVSEKRGGGCTIDNLRPICANCNLSMGTMDMNEYIKKFGLHK